MPRMAWRRSSRSSSSHAVWRRLTRERDVTRTAALAPATKSEASPLQALIAPQPYMGLSLSSTNFFAHAFFSLSATLSPFEISIRGGARLEWPSHRCHILIFGGNHESGSPNHDAIYASAARLRSSGAHSCIRHESHWLWRATATSDRCLARRRPRHTKTDDILPVGLDYDVSLALRLRLAA
jgi:hypothetical protein